MHVKVKKWIEAQAEVEVHVSAEDIIAMFAESPTEKKQLLAGLNSVATFLRGIPESIIAELNRHQRLVITQFFAEQLRRYTPVEETHG
jgi:hypothetical protein